MCCGGWGSIENSPHRPNPTGLAGGLVFQWSTSGNPRPQNGIKKIWGAEPNWKSVLRERWTDEKFEQAQRASCLKDQTKEVRENRSYLWQLGIFGVVVSVDFILFNWIRFSSGAICGKMVISTQIQMLPSQNDSWRPEECSKVALGKPLGFLLCLIGIPSKTVDPLERIAWEIKNCFHKLSYISSNIIYYEQ